MTDQSNNLIGLRMFINLKIVIDVPFILGGNEMNCRSGKRRSEGQNHVIGLTVLFKSISTLKNKNIESKHLSLYYYIKNISRIEVIK